MLFCDLFLLLFFGRRGGGGGGGEKFICSDAVIFFRADSHDNSKTAAKPLTIFVVHAHSEWQYVFLTPCRFWLRSCSLYLAM